MSYKYTRYIAFILIGFGLAYTVLSYHGDEYTINISSIRQHVKYLSSDALEGRLTGSQGEKLATQYVADYFHHLKLEPGGENQSYFQQFDLPEQIAVDDSSMFLITNNKGDVHRLETGKGWFPLTYHSHYTFNEKLALQFVGDISSIYPLEKANINELASDSNIKNKWIVALDDYDHKEVKQPLPYTILAAKERGAKGIIIIDTKDSTSYTGCDALGRSSKSLYKSTFPVFCIKADVINQILSNHHHQQQVGLANNSAVLSDWRYRVIPQLQGLQLNARVKFIRRSRKGRNVIARLALTSKGKETLVLGAHIDHLGRGLTGASRATASQVGMIHPGADDNASGVASMMEVAAKLNALKQSNKLTTVKDILFIAWSGEELGTLGATYFIKNYLKKNTSASSSDSRKIGAVINLDMVGHLDSKLVIQGVGSSKQWKKIITSMEGKRDFSLVLQPDPYLPTDATAFYLKGIPSINFYTGANNTYHTPNDTAESLNYQGIKHMSQFLVALITKLSRSETVLNYQTVKLNKYINNNSRKAYLGTIPDYTSENSLGVMITGVVKGSPAEKSGLLKDDIIIALDGKPVHDIYEYAYLLGTLPIGKTITMIIMRDKKRVDLTIIAEYQGV